MSVKVGERAPNFKLIASDRSEVSLEDFRGKNVVLLFFPMAFSRVCTAELCGMKDDLGTYEELDAQIIAVSADSFYALARFKEDQGINFPLLSDWNKTVCRAYGSLYEKYALGMKGVPKRSAFVIDPEGIVRYAEVLEDTREVPDFQSIKETLAAIKV